MSASKVSFPLWGKVLFVFISTLAISAWSNEVGQIKTLKGKAHIERGSDKLDAQIGAKIFQSDTIVTGADGAVGIAFVDNSSISTGPNSVLAIDRFTFDTTTHVGAFDASLKKGTLAAISGKIAKQTPEAMKIHTPTAVLGVRGTEFVVRADDSAN
jgi:hypothetical protein